MSSPTLFYTFIIIFSIFLQIQCQTTSAPGPPHICTAKSSGTCVGGCDMTPEKKCSKISDCYAGNTYFSSLTSEILDYYCDLKHGVCCNAVQKAYFESCTHRDVSSSRLVLAMQEDVCDLQQSNCTNSFGNPGRCTKYRTIYGRCCPDLNRTKETTDFKTNMECDVSNPFPNKQLYLDLYCRDGHIFVAGSQTLKKNEGKDLKPCQINSDCSLGRYCMRTVTNSTAQCYRTSYSQKAADEDNTGTVATISLIVLAVIICIIVVAAILICKLAMYLIGVAVGVFILIIAIILILYFCL